MSLTPPPNTPPDEGNVPSVSRGFQDADVSEEANQPDNDQQSTALFDSEQSTAAIDHEPFTEVFDNPLPLAALEARDITAWFGDHMVLDGVSLTMQAGEVTALIGPSGCGKSTFLRILNRMHQLVPGAAMAGEVLLDGTDIYHPRIRLTQARRDIGMVFQKPNPFPAMSVYDNVLAGLKLTGIKASRNEKDELVEECLTTAGSGNPAERCQAASSSGCASPARWRSGPGCC